MYVSFRKLHDILMLGSIHIYAISQKVNPYSIKQKTYSVVKPENSAQKHSIRSARLREK